MIRLINSEFFKLRKRFMTQVLLYVLIGLMVILYLLLFAVSRVNLPFHGDQQVGQIENLLGLPVAIPFALAMLASFGIVLAVILIASSVGNEYNWRTIRTALICSESRLKLISAKLIVAGTFIVIGMIIGVAVGFIMSLITTALGGYAFKFDFMTGSYLWDQFVQFWRTFYVMIPYILLGFLFAVLGRSAMPGIALGIGVYFLESIITTFMVLAGGWVAKIPDYLLTANVRAINALNNLPGQFATGPGGGGLLELPDIIHAMVTLAIYSIVFLVIGFYLFRKRDVTG